MSAIWSSDLAFFGWTSFLITLYVSYTSIMHGRLHSLQKQELICYQHKFLMHLLHFLLAVALLIPSIISFDGIDLIIHVFILFLILFSFYFSFWTPSLKATDWFIINKELLSSLKLFINSNNSCRLLVRDSLSFWARKWVLDYGREWRCSIFITFKDG